MKSPFYKCSVDTPLDVCESRDVKELYNKARQGLVIGNTCFMGKGLVTGELGGGGGQRERDEDH